MYLMISLDGLPEFRMATGNWKEFEAFVMGALYMKSGGLPKELKTSVQSQIRLMIDAAKTV